MITKSELDAKIKSADKVLNGKVYDRMYVNDDIVTIIFTDNTFIRFTMSWSSYWGLDVDIHVEKPKRTRVPRQTKTLKHD